MNSQRPVPVARRPSDARNIRLALYLGLSVLALYVYFIVIHA